jgi:hypothetical protein
VSNAADKSSMTNAVGLPLARDGSMSLIMFTKAVSIECPDLYADWNWLSKLKSLQWVLIWLTTTCSTSLETNERPDLGRYFLRSSLSREGFLKVE